MKLARFKDGVFQHFLFADAPDGVETFTTEQRIPKFNASIEAPQFSEVVLEWDVAFEVYSIIPKNPVIPEMKDMIGALLRDDKAKIEEFKGKLDAAEAVSVSEISVAPLKPE